MQRAHSQSAGSSSSTTTVTALTLPDGFEVSPADADQIYSYGETVATQMESVYLATQSGMSVWASAPSRPTAASEALNRTGGMSVAEAADMTDAGRSIYLTIMESGDDLSARKEKMLSLASVMDKALPRSIRDELYEVPADWSSSPLLPSFSSPPQLDSETDVANNQAKGAEGVSATSAGCTAAAAAAAAAAAGSSASPDADEEVEEEIVALSIAHRISQDLTAGAAASSAPTASASASATRRTPQKLNLSYEILPKPDSGQARSVGSIQIVEAGASTDPQTDPPPAAAAGENAEEEDAAAAAAGGAGGSDSNLGSRLQIFTVGREPWNDVHIPGSNISRLHMVVFVYPRGTIIVDGWSFHGTRMVGRANAGLRCDASVPKARQPLYIPAGESVTMSLGPFAKMTVNPVECGVCFDRARSVRFECGHLFTCEQCAQRLTECPVCRAPINRRRSAVGTAAAANGPSFQRRNSLEGNSLFRKNSHL